MCMRNEPRSKESSGSGVSKPWRPVGRPWEEHARDAAHALAALTNHSGELSRGTSNCRRRADRSQACVHQDVLARSSGSGHPLHRLDDAGVDQHPVRRLAVAGPLSVVMPAARTGVTARHRHVMSPMVLNAAWVFTSPVP